MPQVQLQGPLTSCVWLGGQERPQGWGAASRTSGLPCCRSASQQVPCPPIHYFEEAMGHRSFVTCPDSGTKQWVMKMARSLKVSKSKIGFNAVQEYKERILGKTAFRDCLKAEARFTPGFLSFCGLGKEYPYLKCTSSQVPWQALDSTLIVHI